MWSRPRPVPLIGTEANINLQFYGNSTCIAGKLTAPRQPGFLVMFALSLLQTSLSAVSTVFGGLGIFFLYYSFDVPELSAYALMFLGTATAIVLSRRSA